MSDDGPYRDGFVEQTDDPDEWTPAMGWRRVGKQLCGRAVVALAASVGMMMFVGQVWSEELPARAFAQGPGALLVLVGLAQGLIMSWRLVEWTGIVSRLLFPAVVAMICSAMLVAWALTAPASLAGLVVWVVVPPAMAASAVACRVIYRAF